MKEILEVGENIGKPGKPYLVTVSIEGYFAKPREYDEIRIIKPGEKNSEIAK